MNQTPPGKAGLTCSALGQRQGQPGLADAPFADDGDQARTGIDELLRQALELLLTAEEGGEGAGQEAGGRAGLGRSQMRAALP